MFSVIKYRDFIENPMRFFSDEQVMEYIVKYLIINQDNPDESLLWENAKHCKEQIDKVPGLRTLIQTPFLLMVTMEVMSRIVEQYAKSAEKERTTITIARLLDEFVQQLFECEEDKLMVEGKMPTDGRDVKEDFCSFAMELAVTMHESDTYSLHYVTPESSTSRDKHTNLWERFFGTPEDREKAENLVRAREGCSCILKKIADDRYAFIHASLQDYFVIRKIKLEEEKKIRTEGSFGRYIYLLPEISRKLQDYFTPTIIYNQDNILSQLIINKNGTVQIINLQELEQMQAFEQKLFNDFIVQNLGVEKVFLSSKAPLLDWIITIGGHTEPVKTFTPYANLINFDDPHYSLMGNTSQQSSSSATLKAKV